MASKRVKYKITVEERYRGNLKYGEAYRLQYTVQTILKTFNY